MEEKMEKRPYMVVVAKNNHASLVEQVNFLVKEGYKPQGGLGMLPVQEPKHTMQDGVMASVPSASIYYYQAVYNASLTNLKEQ